MSTFVNAPVPAPSMADVSIILALLAALGYGVSDFSGGLAARRVRSTTALLYSYPVATVLILALLPLAPGDLTPTSAGLAAS